MAVYAVFEPPRGDDRDRAMRTVFVREGFSWGAFLLPIPWLIWRRMWLVLIGYLLVAFILGVVLDHWAPGAAAETVIGLGAALLFGLEANGLRRGTLRRKGLRETGAAAGANRDAAERAYFARMSERATPASKPVPAQRATGAADPGVLGSMPAGA